jgi:DnaK suppressor protein
MTDAAFIAAMKEALETRLAESVALTDSTQESRRPVELDQQSVGRLARMDAMQQQAMALATQQRRLTEQKRLRAALRRIETDDYGWCARCGEAIDADRLRRDPAITLCLPCMRGRD